MGFAPPIDEDTKAIGMLAVIAQIIKSAETANFIKELLFSTFEFDRC